MGLPNDYTNVEKVFQTDNTHYGVLQVIIRIYSNSSGATRK